MYMDKVERHAALCGELNRTYKQKNHDYGDSFHLTFQEEGMAMVRIRLSDKFNRFKTLSRSAEQEVADESIRDTLMDLANYALMTVMELDMMGSDTQQAAEKPDLRLADPWETVIPTVDCATCGTDCVRADGSFGETRCGRWTPKHDCSSCGKPFCRRAGMPTSCADWMPKSELD